MPILPNIAEVRSSADFKKNKSVFYMMFLAGLLALLYCIKNRQFTLSKDRPATAAFRFVRQEINRVSMEIHG